MSARQIQFEKRAIYLEWPIDVCLLMFECISLNFCTMKQRQTATAVAAAL